MDDVTWMILIGQSTGYFWNVLPGDFFGISLAVRRFSDPFLLVRRFSLLHSSSCFRVLVRHIAPILEALAIVIMKTTPAIPVHATDRCGWLTNTGMVSLQKQTQQSTFVCRVVSCFRGAISTLHRDSILKHVVCSNFEIDLTPGGWLWIEINHRGVNLKSLPFVTLPRVNLT